MSTSAIAPNLNLLDEYIETRKINGHMDLTTLLVTVENDSGVDTDISTYSRRVIYDSTLGYNLKKLTFTNNSMGYFYITRCYNERLFNEIVLKKTIPNNDYPVNLTVIFSSGEVNVISKLKKIHTDFKIMDNKHYFYTVDISEHTFIIVKFNKDFRIIQSWMLKYQLENNIYNDDFSFSVPKFIILLFINDYYMSKKLNDKNKLIYIIKEVFQCNNLQAKEYLEEFKINYMYVFSKELHYFLPGSDIFSLDLELDSEKYLGITRNSEIELLKYKFNPNEIMSVYNDLITDTNDILSSSESHREVREYFRQRMGTTIPFYRLTNRANAPEKIQNIIKNITYPYARKDHHYDSLVLTTIMKNYTIISDKSNILNNLVNLASLKNIRDMNLVNAINNIHNITDFTAKLLDIYHRNNLGQIGGAEPNEYIHQANSNFSNLAKLSTDKNIENKNTDASVSKIINLTKLSAKLSDVKNKKIEKNRNYQFKNKIIMNINNKISNGQILPMFSNINVFKGALTPDEIIELNSNYLQTKEKILRILHGQLEANYAKAVKSLSKPHIIITTLKLYLEHAEIKSLVGKIISMRKKEYMNMIQTLTGTKIIENFGTYSIKKQNKLLEDLNLIEQIEANKQIITTKINQMFLEIASKIQEKLFPIYKNLSDIEKTSNNTIPLDVLIEFGFSTLSNLTDLEKFKALVALETNGGDEINGYIDNLLDSEVICMIRQT